MIPPLMMKTAMAAEFAPLIFLVTRQASKNKKSPHFLIGAFEKIKIKSQLTA